MFHAAHAALVIVKSQRPRSHAGTIHLFLMNVVRVGKLDERFAKDLQDAYDLRQGSDYDVFASVSQDQATEIVQKAGAFVAEVKRLLAQQDVG